MHEGDLPIHPENVGYVAHSENVDEPKYQIAIPIPSGSKMASAKLGIYLSKLYLNLSWTEKSKRRRSTVDIRLPWQIYTLTAEPRDLDLQSVGRSVSAMLP